MGNLLIKGFPDDLRWKLKKLAMERQEPMKTIVVSILAGGAEEYGKHAEKETLVTPQMKFRSPGISTTIAKDLERKSKVKRDDKSRCPHGLMSGCERCGE